MHRALSLLLSLLPLVGCVDASVVVQLNPDASGSFDLDIGYDQRSWPAFFGDPFRGWLRKSQLQGFTDPGLGPWAEPRIVEVDGFRRFRTEVFFDDLDRVQILGWDDGRPFEALGFRYDREQHVVRMRLGIMEQLSRPLPLPSPKQAGMEVSISDALMAAIRQEIRPVIEGARLRLAARLPGEVERADGFDAWQDREAWVEADADRIAAALRDRAALLFNPSTLGDGNLVLQWNAAPPSEEEGRRYRERRAAAQAWWDTPPR